MVTGVRLGIELGGYLWEGHPCRREGRGEFTGDKITRKHLPWNKIALGPHIDVTSMHSIRSLLESSRSSHFNSGKFVVTLFSGGR